MKRIKNLLLLILALIVTVNVSVLNVEAQVDEQSLGYTALADRNLANDLIPVKNYQVLEGDHYQFSLDLDTDINAIVIARPLMMEAPDLETEQPYAEAAKLRVEELFEEADQIHIEYDTSFKGQGKDEWLHVWIDNVLLQEVLVTEGFAIPRHIHNENLDDKYVDAIYASADFAKKNNYNIWGDGDSQFLSKAEFYIEAPTAAPETSTPDLAETPDSASEVITEAEPTEQMVYVAPYSGTKYHYSPNCRGLSNANDKVEMTLTDAQNQGYSLCGWED